MGKLIMIVDDSVSVRQMAGLTLRREGFSVVEACDGKDAFSKLEAGPVDMLVTDLNMPGLDGIELIKQVRAMPHHRYIPIIMLTTESQMEKKAAGRAAGASGWIVKPFTAEQLIRVVQKVLR